MTTAWIAAIASVALFVACQATVSPPLQADPPPAPATSEPGADPALTQRFDAPDRALEYWIKRFEGESREVYVERHAIVDALELEAGTHLADIGAGTGVFEPLLSQAVGAGGRVYAVDISPRFLEHLRDRKQAEGWSNVTVVEGTEKSPSLAPDSVDVVFTSATYHHFTHVAETLAGIKSALRSGGRMIVVDFHRIPGESSEWVLGHVRADMETVRAEIEAAGFRYARSIEILKENFILEFELPAP